MNKIRGTKPIVYQTKHLQWRILVIFQKWANLTDITVFLRRQIFLVAKLQFHEIVKCHVLLFSFLFYSTFTVFSRLSRYWTECQANVVTRLLEDCQLKDRFSPEVLNRCIGVLEVNNHEIHLTSSGAGYRAFYPVAHTMSHVCAPNSIHVRDTSGETGYAAKCVATVDISEGEDIVTNVIKSWTHENNGVPFSIIFTIIFPLFFSM